MKLSRVVAIILFVLCITPAAVLAAETADAVVGDGLVRAGENRPEIESALARIAEDKREGMRFLVAHMPDRDLQSLKADFLVENVDLAYRAWEESSWKDTIPEDVFLNNILPYASINERRDAWRADFYKRFRPLVQDLKSPGKAAARLNQRVFPDLNVRYSTRRRKADQSPLETMESGLASCTGLSILLIDACRAVGIPARFVGTPLWSDRSGNHSWVEVWDNGWHFTGAAEPAGDELDKAWFVGRASTAQRDSRRHAIYAVSFRQTPLRFPMVWNRSADYVCAVNVTDRYANRFQKLAAGHTHAMFRVLDRPGGERRSVPLKVRDGDGNMLFDATTNDERFDANDHITVALPVNVQFVVELDTGGDARQETIQTQETDHKRQLFTFYLDAQSAAD